MGQGREGFGAGGPAQPVGWAPMAPTTGTAAGARAGVPHGRAATSFLCLPLRIFEYRGRVSPVPRVVPVKRPRVTIPLVRRVKATLPVKLFARSAAIANSSAKLKCECVPGLGTRVGQRGALPKNPSESPKHLEPAARLRECRYSLSVPKPGLGLHSLPETAPTGFFGSSPPASLPVSQPGVPPWFFCLLRKCPGAGAGWGCSAVLCRALSACLSYLPPSK